MRRLRGRKRVFVEVVVSVLLAESSTHAQSQNGTTGLSTTATLTSPYTVESLTRNEIRELECGLYGLSSYFTVSFAGVADADLCGTCIAITCLDEAACKEGAGSLVAAVVDGAEEGEVAVNRYLARSLVGRALAEGEALAVTYEVVDCAPYGTILETQAAFQEFQEQLTGSGAAQGAPVTETAPAPAPAPAPTTGTTQQQATQPTPVPSVDASRVVTVAPAPEPAAVPAPEPAPAPAPAPAPTTGTTQQQATQPVASEARASDVTSVPSSTPSGNQTSPTPSDTTHWWIWGLIGKHLLQTRQPAPPTLTNEKPVMPSKGELDNRMQQMACGLSEAMYLDRKAFAAMNSFAFESVHGFNPCGMCASVTTPAGKSLEVMFVDDCGTCGENDMLISEEGLEALGPVEEGTTYSVHPCSSQRGVFLSVIDTDSYYMRFGLGNLPEAIDIAQINGNVAEKNHLGQFEVYADMNRVQPGGYTVELTMQSGKQLTTVVPFLESQWLNVRV